MTFLKWPTVVFLFIHSHIYGSLKVTNCYFVSGSLSVTSQTRPACMAKIEMCAHFLVFLCQLASLFNMDEEAEKECRNKVERLK